MQVEDRNRKNKEELLAYLEPVQQNMIQAKVAEEQRQNSLAMKQEERAYKENQAKVANDQQVRNILLRDQLARDRKLEESKLPLTAKEQADLEIKARNATTSEGNLDVSRQRLEISKGANNPKAKVAEVKAKQSAENSANRLNVYANQENITWDRGSQMKNIQIKIGGDLYKAKDGIWYKVVDGKDQKVDAKKKEEAVRIKALNTKAGTVRKLFADFDTKNKEYSTKKTVVKETTSEDPASKWEVN